MIQTTKTVKKSSTKTTVQTINPFSSNDINEFVNTVNKFVYENNINRPISYTEFKLLSDESKIMYICWLRNEYNASCKMIYTMLDITRTPFMIWYHKLNISKFPCQNKKCFMNKEEIVRFMKFAKLNLELDHDNEPEDEHTHESNIDIDNISKNHKIVRTVIVYECDSCESKDIRDNIIDALTEKGINVHCDIHCI